MSLSDRLAENMRLVNALFDRKDEKIAELEARLRAAEKALRWYAYEPTYRGVAGTTARNYFEKFGGNTS